MGTKQSSQKFKKVLNSVHKESNKNINKFNTTTLYSFYLYSHNTYTYWGPTMGQVFI